MTVEKSHLAAVLAAELAVPAAPGAEILELYHHILTRHIEDNDGTVLSKSGADLQASFPTPGNAIRCAAAIQRQIAERSRNFPSEAMKIEMGIHLGEIRRVDGGAVGEGLSAAKRLRAACRPGGILVSEDIARRCSDETEFRFEPSGGLGEPGTPRYIHPFYLRPAGSPGGERNGRNDTIRPEEVRDHILGEIKRAGRRIDADWLRKKLPADDPDIQKGLNWLVKRGFLDEKVLEDGKTGYSMSSRSSGPDMPSRVDPKFLRYRKKIEKEAKKALPGFRSHLTTFLSVNAGLVVLNLLTSRSFPWVLFPIGGWGIGLFTHYVSTRVTDWKKRHLDTLPDLDREQYTLVKKMHNTVGGFAGHASSNAAVATFLLMTDIITGPGFMWSLIPITAMAIPVLIHWSTMRSRMRKLGARLKEAITSRPAGHAGASSGSTDPAIIEAERLRSAILKQVHSLGDQAYLLGDDIPSLLDSYVSNIRMVAGKVQEIDRVIAEIPVASLQQDRKQLEARLAEAEKEYLKAEYRTSIEEIDSQLTGCRELQEQEEYVRLKLRSSLNSMKQLQLDVARVAGSASIDSGEISTIEREIRDLSEHMDDLQAGYDELDK